jgi:transcriptional regulator with XRE-family HTH domain
MEDISLNIKQICKENGYKQDFIADKMGITQGTLSGKLLNGNDIKYSLLLEISNITGISVIDIITYPVKYAPKTDDCVNCHEKEETIRNLNNYIRILDKK